MNKLMITFVAAIGVLSSFAATYYADASRQDDTGDGKSAATAKHTLQEAVKLATEDGDVVMVLPGVYNEGSVVPDGATLPTRVYLTKKITLKSTQGKAVTHIVGRRQSATVKSGCGANAMRCITLADTAKGAIIDGFTIRDGATMSNGTTYYQGINKQGGGVWANEATVGNDYYVCNSTVRDCESLGGGGMYAGTAVSSLFIHNYANSDDGSAGKCTAFVNSVIARNYGYYAISSPGGIAVNCTIVENDSVAFYPAWGYAPRAYNCVFGANTSITDGGNNTSVLSNSVCSSTLGYWNVTANSIMTNLYSSLLFAPARGDFRLLADSPAVGLGDPALLAAVSVPPAYANRDYLGSPIDVTAKTINAGAVQATATPQTGMVRLSYPQQISVDGFPAATRTFDSYLYADSASTQVRLTSSFDEVFRFRNATQSIHYYPDLEDGVWFTMPPAGTAIQDLRVDAAAAILYVDGSAKDDSGDGKTTAAAKRTIQAAVDAVTADKTIIYVAPGTYDEGGKFAGALSNRVAVTAYDTCIRATGKASETFIVGAPDPETGGYGYNATRCVLMGKSGAIRGFTITGGWTANATDSTHTDGNCVNGGALFASSGSVNSQITDSVITNNHAAIGSLACYGGVCRCFARDNPATSKGTYSCTFVSSVIVHNSNRTYYFRDNTLMFNCTVYGEVASTTIADTTCRYFDTILHNCGSMQPYNATCYFWGNALDGNTSFNKSRGDGGGTLDSSFVKLSIPFADPLRGDFRTIPLAALDVAGEPFSKVNAWKYSGGDYCGEALKVTDGRIKAGAVQGVCTEVVTITNLNGSVTIVNGFIGENAIPDGKTITITATDTSRPFLGFRVDGVLMPRGSNSLVVDGTYAGKTVEAVYVTDWYVDAEEGNDENDGMTADTPKRTLQAVLSRKLFNGDTVHAAAGVYDEGEMRYSSAFYQPGDKVCELPSRAVVTNGVTLVADEGPLVTFIVGETSTSPDAFGNGPGAMRCVTLASNAKVVGFTLTGGHTLVTTTSAEDDDKNGGAVLGLAPFASIVENCTITNNAAVLGGGCLVCSMVNCRLSDDRASNQGAAGFLVNSYGCYFDGFACDHYLLSYYLQVLNCTFGADLYSGDGVTQKKTFGNANGLSGTWGGSVANNVFLIPISWSLSYDVPAFNSVFIDNNGIAKQNTTNCVFVTDAATWFNGAVPIANSSSPVVGIADTAKVSSLLGGVDAAGNTRISNGAVDPGAFQSDWRTAYARDLAASRDFVCASVSSCVTETDDRQVRLGNGSIAFVTRKVLTDEKLHFEAVVDGNGTLVVESDGEVVATFTSADSSVSTDIELNGTKPTITVRYVAGAADVGSAVLKRFRLNFEPGMFIIVR